MWKSHFCELVLGTKTNNHKSRKAKVCIQKKYVSKISNLHHKKWLVTKLLPLNIDETQPMLSGSKSKGLSSEDWLKQNHVLIDSSQIIILALL